MKYFCICLSTVFLPLHLHAAEHEPYYESRARTVFIEGNSDGRSASLKLRVGINSAWFDGFTSTVELDHVESAWQDEFNDGSRNNGKPFIPDLESSELNQAFLSLDRDEWRLSLGRKRIDLDDERFIGSHDFWQDDQTFDSVLVQRELFSATRFQYYYIDQANRIMGDESISDSLPALRQSVHDHESHLLHLNIADFDYQDLSLFYYDIDIEQLQAASGQNLGFRYQYERHFAGFRPLVELSAVRQKRTLSSDSFNYYLLDAGFGFNRYRLRYRYEYLGSNGTASFVTPLGSLHNFHGRADKFGVAPAEGLLDQSMSIGWRKAPFKFELSYHQFDAVQGNTDFGSELDFDFIYRHSKHHEFFVSFSDFRASEPSRDRFASETRVYLNYTYSR